MLFVPWWEVLECEHVSPVSALQLLTLGCRTQFFLVKPDTPENMAAFVSTVPLGRGSTPKDVANACCYLASDEAEFVTGINLEVDGGRTV